MPPLIATTSAALYMKGNVSAQMYILMMVYPF